ncbi:hypothetical protein JCGZ_05831 [Jatropha curcas]|uniref:Uncharacterized protein n=1 Tax=Jatropha curcas TaxID=180498 RepID=A0A067J8N7_JATCU|nr:hypothetical protein JCGZ_05831 [Jatropha curcas]
MASVIQSLPGQQPPPMAGEIEQPASSSSSWHSSGSIGPFFGVISVLAVLAILSCILGRVCSRRAVAPPPPQLDNRFKHRGYLGWWMKRKNRWCRGGDVEVGANNKVMALGDQDCKAEDGEVHDQQPPQA